MDMFWISPESGETPPFSLETPLWLDGFSFFPWPNRHLPSNGAQLPEVGTLKGAKDVNAVAWSSRLVGFGMGIFFSKINRTRFEGTKGNKKIIPNPQGEKTDCMIVDFLGG